MALVIFLRGVNVGGHKTFRPTMIVEKLKKYGVVNIGAAGTFIVQKPISQARLRAELLDCLPFACEIAICSGRELIAAASASPGAARPARPDIVRFVTILTKRPAHSPSIPLHLPEKGKWLLSIEAQHGRFLFGHYRREMRAIGYLGAIDKLFGAPATTRSRTTISTIIARLQK